MKFMLALAGIVALVAAAPQGGAPNPNPTPTPTSTPTPPAAFQAIPTCGANILNPVIEASGCQFTDPACFCAKSDVQAVPAQVVSACGSGTTNEQTCVAFLNQECNGQSGWPINPST